MEDNDKRIENFHKILATITKENLEKYLPKEDPIPFGWISIEEHLPMVTCDDFLKNDAIVKVIKVRYSDGTEDISHVGDHNIWYYRAKEAGITHWLNEK